MDEMGSSEFRKHYATLRTQVYVTVNGHVIGHWIPANAATYVAGKTEVFGLEPPPDATIREPQSGDPVFRFNSRPFTPVPKKGK